MEWLSVVATSVAALWAIVLLLPWQYWRNREVLEPCHDDEALACADLTVLIPARDEAGVIAATLQSLARQAPGLKVVLVDDQSSDGTVEEAMRVTGVDLTIVTGRPLPPRWSGKLWALEQGLARVETEKVLLLDADIELLPGMLRALLNKMTGEGKDMVSVMAWLRTRSLWEKLLMPAFVYFFKFLYPFALANSRLRWFAAAAGGCILVKTGVLRECGAFSSLKEALIDDCTLATRVKNRGYRIWIGLSHGVISNRAYDRLETIWDMVARTAFTQLCYSTVLLFLSTVTMGGMFWVPLAALLTPGARLAGVAALTLMTVAYLPTLRFYRLSPAWGLLMPIIASLYMAMTLSSAWRYWQGKRSQWKGRVYSRRGDEEAIERSSP